MIATDTVVCAAATVGLAPDPEKLVAAVWTVVAKAVGTPPSTGSPPALARLADNKAVIAVIHNTLSMDLFPPFNSSEPIPHREAELSPFSVIGDVVHTKRHTCACVRN